ncbi:hypothetical protein BVY13_12300 [Bacillus amyloliquefaciens]|nr:hypothetical protein BVY13_12300 [Bacillus amyloliquefaciens]
MYTKNRFLKNVRAVPAAENGHIVLAAEDGRITGHTVPAAEDGRITGHTVPAAEDGRIAGHTVPAAEDGRITGHTVPAADGPIKNAPANAVLNADCRLYYK